MSTSLSRGPCRMAAALIVSSTMPPSRRARATRLMRSCLIQLLLELALLFAILWFGLPLGAGFLATSALNASGFTGTNTSVEVSANPPPALLTGKADTIRIRSDSVYVGDLRAASMDVTLHDVGLLSRKIGSVDGTLDGVRIAVPSGDPLRPGTGAHTWTANTTARR